MVVLSGNESDSGHKLVSVHGLLDPGEHHHDPTDCFFLTGPVLRATQDYPDYPVWRAVPHPGPCAIHAALPSTTGTRPKTTGGADCHERAGEGSFVGAHHSGEQKLAHEMEALLRKHRQHLADFGASRSWPTFFSPEETSRTLDRGWPGCFGSLDLGNR